MVAACQLLLANQMFSLLGVVLKAIFCFKHVKVPCYITGTVQPPLPFVDTWISSWLPKCTWFVWMELALVSTESENCTFERKVFERQFGFSTEHSLSTLHGSRQAQKLAKEAWKGNLDLVDDSSLHYDSYASALRSSGNLKALSDGKRIHDHIITTGFVLNLLLGNLLLQMYDYCGALEDACTVFDKMHQRDRFSWNFMIRAHARCGHVKEVLGLFTKMQEEGVMPDKFIFASILSACSKQDTLSDGRLMHTLISSYGFETDVVVGTALVNMYGKCGSLENACKTFNSIHERNAVSWNSMITVYLHLGQEKDAPELLQEMQQEGITPGKVTFLKIFEACASKADLAKGKQMHACIVGSEHDLDVVVQTALVNMYGKCGCVQDARGVFDKMPEQDVVSWNAMIAAYAQQDLGEDALQLFEQMNLRGARPDEITLVSILDACGSQAALIEGKSVHDHIVGSGFESNVILGTALMNMYGKCGSLEDARSLFNKMNERNVVSWNAMMTSYVQHGEGNDIFCLFELMQQEGLIPDKVTYLSVCDACAIHAALAESKRIHARILASGLDLDVVLGSALVNMYGKCGTLEDARMVFDKMPERNMVTFVNLISACANLGALAEGKRVHNYIVDSGLELDVLMSTALVNMYGKCGVLDVAWKIFHDMPRRNVVSWNAMIAAFAQQGQGKRALELFKQMRHDGVMPDEATFISVLSACSHAGLVDEGRHHFDSIDRDYGIAPIADHYNCLIDILGRAGRLDEAENLIKEMPFQATVVSWATLLGACRSHIDVVRGERAANNLFELDPWNPVPYVTLANIYEAVGRDDDAAELLKRMKEKGLKTQPGFTSIEVNGRVHIFRWDAHLHPKKKEIYDELQRWDREMEVAGWVPDSLILRREHMLCSHTERLAVAFGLISMPSGTPMLITKNLQICHYCHHATKFASKMAQQEIVVRDAYQFHHMKDGVCSCAG